MGKYISKNVSGKYIKKLLDHAKQYATDALKTSSRRAIQKTAAASGDLIGNKIADRSTKFSKTSQQNSSETVIDEHDEEKYLSPEERRKIILMI